MAPGVVERFLDAMAAHDWDAMAACVSATVERVGPYGDTYLGREAYVTFLADLLPTLEGYVLHVDRVTYAPPRSAFAELSETVVIDGQPLRTPEALVFDIDDDGRIGRVAVYMQSRPPST